MKPGMRAGWRRGVGPAARPVLALLLLLLDAPSVTSAIGPARSMRGSLLVLRKRNVAIGATGFGLGDELAQRLEGGDRRDARRLFNAVALGGTWAGTCTPQVYALSEWLLPGRSVVRVLTKVGLSCGFLSTGGNWINMFARRVAAGTGSLGEAASATSDDLFWSVVWADLKVWPLYDLVCFSVVPPAVRPATTACFSAAWNTYMSLVSARAQGGAL